VLLRLIEPARFDAARVATIRAFKDAGLGLNTGHRAVSELAERGEAVVAAPLAPALAAKLKAAGIAVVEPAAPEIDIVAVRARTGLSQSAFAARYGLNLRTLQGIERRGRIKDPATRAFFWLIANDPEAVDRALGISA
jgi:putative transcriptional regulator